MLKIWVQIGTAVFKARMLYALFNPAVQFNDRLNCLPQTQNKSSNNNNTTTNIDSLLEIQVNEDAIKLYEYNNYQIKKDSIKELANLIQVYPNPAINYIYVQLPQSTKADMLIYNAIGSIVKKETIFNNSKIILNDLSNGLYTYKLIIEKQNYFGKLTIKK